MTNNEKVKEFMTTFGQEVLSESKFPDMDVVKLRYELIREELEELHTAIDSGDFIDAIDALTDILYVTYGAGHSFGVDLDKCFEEVHNSNMSKLDENRKPIYREDGKVLKGPNYFPPDLKKVVFG